MTVLDVGCGVDRFTLPLAQAVGPVGQVVALDLQAEMLARLREKAEAAGLRSIGTVEGASGHGDLEAGRFDRALLASVLGEIPPADRLPALAEIRGALKPDGAAN